MLNKFSQAILTLEEPETHLHPQAVRAFEKQLRGIETQKIMFQLTLHILFKIRVSIKLGYSKRMVGTFQDIKYTKASDDYF